MVNVRLKITGDFACFTRPENKVERVSYECMTPSAARNILDAICWKPEMRWVVTRIHVLRPVVFQSLRRNELQSKASIASLKKWAEDASDFRPMLAGAGSDDVTQRSTLALRDVGYVIEAFPHVFAPTAENTPTKYMAMFNRRVEKGQCFQRPSLGCREFAANFELAGPDERGNEDVNVDLGMMLYDIVFRRDANRPDFFRAQVRKGILDTHPEIAISDPELRMEVLSCSYKR